MQTELLKPLLVFRGLSDEDQEEVEVGDVEDLDEDDDDEDDADEVGNEKGDDDMDAGTPEE